MKYRTNVRIVDPKVIRLFERYHWPGNVRELERVLAHAFVFVKGPVIFPNHLPEQEELGFSRTSALSSPPPIGAMKDRNAIRWALGQTDGNRRKAAALLGISRTSMWRRMKELEI